MKKIVLLLAAVVISAMMFVTPGLALEKLHDNASEQETYEYALELRKRLEKLPENQIDELKGTLSDLLGIVRHELRDELIYEAKAKHGNPEAQYKLGWSYSCCINKFNDGAHNRFPVMYQMLLWETEAIGLNKQTLSYRTYCFTKTKSIFEKVLHNPRANMKQKCYALGELSHAVFEYAGILHVEPFCMGPTCMRGNDMLSVQDRLKYLNMAKQYAIQMEQFAKGAKNRELYRQGEYYVKMAEISKKWLVNNETKKQQIKNFLQ